MRQHYQLPKKSISFFVFSIFMLLINIDAKAQFDTQFWMPPVWDPQSGATNNPSSLTLTTTFPTANVNVRTPDGSTFNQNYVVTTGTATTINLSTILGMTTNINNPELDKGLIITSDIPIQAVYRINANNNKAMVTLKGKSALGTSFRAGSQTHTRQAQYYTGDKHFVSVMATQDNTTITFTTEQGFTYVGQGGNPTTINLDAGETYVMRSDLNDIESVAGTLIESDKDIVATTGAQHVRIIGGSAGDAGIDQIVPIENLGTEYIVVKGGVANTFDYAMITAAYDNTDIFIDGNGTAVATINAGETYEYFLPGGAAEFGEGHYIRTSEPAYVYHVTGSGLKNDEVGMAIIPPINCTGSRYIQFTPFAGSENAVTITIPTAGLATLEFNGAAYNSYGTHTVNAVPGVTGYSTVTIDDGDLTNDNIFTSDEAFHLGLLVGNGASGTYGFLSGFTVGIDILDPVTLQPVDFYFADSIYQGQTTEHCILMDACDPENRAIDITESPNTGGTSIVAAPKDTCFNYTASTVYAGADTIQVNVENDNILIQGGSFLKDSVQIGFYIFGPPIADPDTYTYDPCNYNAPYEVLVNDTDPNDDIDTMTVTITRGPLDPRNTASVEVGSGNIIFTADPDFTGIETIIYEVCDKSSPTLLCDTALVTIDVQPGVDNNAGANDTLCANNPNATLNGSISIVNAGYWSGGDGAFLADSTDLGATYIPSAAEIATGRVNLILTSESTLATVSTSVRANDDAEERANSTDVTSNDLDMNEGDREYCAIRYENFTLPDEAVLISAEVIFTAKNSSTGDVTFEIYGHDANNSGAFTPADNDISSRTPTTASVSWSPADWTQGNRAQGPEQTTPDITSVVSEVVSRPGWSNGNALTLIFRAVSGSGERVAWSYNNNNGEDAAELVYTYYIPGCPETKDTVSLIYLPAPTVDAGDDGAVCANNATYTLDGSFDGSATGITWSGGAGTFSDVNDVNATYTPNAAETTAGGVTLTIESIDDEDCIPVTDDMFLEITPVPTIDAGAPISVCENDPTASLNGTMTIATAAEWTTTGSGVFADSSDLMTTYTPSNADITAGSVKLYLTTTAQGTCNPVVDSVVVTITSAPTVDAGSIITVCQNDPDATLNGSVGAPATGGAWSSAGGGTFSPSPTDLNATYTPSTAEISAGIAELILTSTGNGNCLEETDNVIIIISDSQSVDAGPTLDVCSNNPIVNLSATTSAGITSVAWSGGAGTYNPANNVANTAYTATAAEVSGGSLTLTISASKPGCNDVSDDVLINFTPAPTANAGNDVSVCANNPDVALNGVVTVATGGSWQSISGSPGTFSPSNNQLAPVYTPSATEIANGLATLVMTTTGNNNCNAVTDTIEVEITPAPTVDPGTYTAVCANNATISLNGSVTIASGGQWSAGGGTFNPSNTNLTATYVPTAAEISAGVVNMTLTSTGNNNCNAVFGNTSISITPSPVPNPGNDDDVCEDNPTITLGGSVSVATGGIWTGGAGTFTPNNTTLNASYQPTPTEVTNGTVTLTLTTTDNGNCNAESATVTYDITNAPTVDAGSDQTVCGSTSSVALNGTITIASGGRWTTTGDGSFSPNSTTIDASYEPGNDDVLAGAVTLTLTTTGNGKCDAYDDDMTITFTAVPTADAGDPQTVCTNDFPIQLDGSGSQSVWSGGSGTFNPDNTTLNATYTPSVAEINAGSVTLTQSTVANGACNTVTDDVTFTILPGPIADAGSDDVICASDGSYTLSGAISGTATGSMWYTAGTGTFDNATLLNATYTPSYDDTAARSVFLVLETTGTGFCSVMRDTMELEITPAVYALPGNDRTICANTGAIPLFGRTYIARTGQWSGGGGTYDVDDTDLTGTYTPTNAEITAGSVTLTLTTTDNGACTAHSDDVTFTIEPAPTVDIGTDFTVCADSSNIPFTAVFTVATGVEWSTTGTGVFSPANTNTSVTYSPTNADTTAGSIFIKATSTGNGICLTEADSIELTITPVPIVNAGGDQLLCADIGTITIDGHVSFATGGSWTTSGTGTFNPNNTTIDVDYLLSSADSAGGVVTLTLTSTGNGACQPVEDKAIITLSPAPTIEAGGDQIVCANDVQIDVIAVPTIATGGTWTTSGSGTFDNANALATFYVPSSADTTAGSVRLYVESTGNGDCNPVTDSLTVTFEPVPAIYAGEDTTICADYGSLPLAATFTNAGGLIWSSTGTGVFSPSAIDPNATYNITSADTAAGSLFLIATTTTNGPCNAEDDSLEVIINPAPFVLAGDDVTVCGDTAGIQLEGEVIIATGGIWTTSGTGTFSPDATSLDAIYIPSAADTAVGTVTLTLTSTGNDLCNPASDQLIVTIDPAPYVSAGNDRTICADLSNISLDGTIMNATGGMWSTSGNGVFSSSNTTIDAIYTPSTSDKSADSVLLVLESTGNGLCKTYYDTLVLRITPIPTVEAGPSRVICASQSSVSLDGGYSNAGGGIWSTNGNGSFFPNNVDSSASYRPDVATDSLVTIYYSATDIGTCNPVVDSMTIRLVPVPVVDAGNNIDACTDQNSIDLNGSVTNALGAGWITSGSGVFVPDSSGTTVSYEPSALDKTVGTIVLTIESWGSSACPPDQDNLTINFTDQPGANAGPDQALCIKDDSVRLSGIMTNGSDGFWYAQNGFGYFNPNADSTTVVYYIAPEDTLQGSVTFEFWVDGLIPECSSAIDEMTITFNSAPVIDAGGPIMDACADTSGFTLNGSGSSGTWSGGSGTFVPNNTTLNATYKPTLAEIGTGFVNLTLTSNSSGACPPTSSPVQVNFQPVPEVDAGGDQTICADSSGIQFPATVDVATQVQWISSGSGTFSPDATTLQPVYIPSAKDISDSTLTITVLTTDNGICDAARDRIRLYINPAPVVDAGLDEITCADRDTMNLVGTIENAGGGEWSTTGDGSFDPDEFTLNTDYLISSNDSTNGAVTFYLTSTGNGYCKAVTDTVELTLTPAVAAYAGVNDTICASENEFQLVGVVTTALGGKWSTTNGTGTFSPNEFALNAKYIPSTGDKITEDVTIVLTTTNNGTCYPVTDTLELNLAPLPESDAGTNQTICANNAGAVLNGFINNAGGGIWETNGTGAFSPDATTLNTTYIQSQDDIDAGAVLLSLTTTDNGYCDSVTSFVNITITPAPESSVYAGFDQTICADVSSVDVEGTVIIAGGGAWTTTGTGTFADTTDLTTTYTLSAADLSQPFIDMILQTTDNGICNAVTDTSRVFITPAPTIDAGTIPQVCADITEVPLDGTVTVATGGLWRASGTGIFTPNSSTVDATYIPSELDRTRGIVALAITSTGNGLCKPVTDFTTLQMTPAPTASAGADQIICEDKLSTALNGKVTIAGGGEWTSSGSGSFIPDNTTLQASYQPSAADINAEVVVLTLTTTDNGLCNSAFDRMTLTITDAPEVEANNDQLSCANNPSILLNGSVLNASGGIWSGGSGTFTPNNSTLNATYTPSVTEISNGVVSLTLTSTGNDLCNDYSDNMTLDIVASPVVNITSSDICAEIGEDIEATGDVLHADGRTDGLWSSSGTGNFAPAIDDQMIFYTPSTADITNGKVTLTLTSDANATCLPVTDQIEIIIKELPSAEAGVDQTICRSDATTLSAITYPDIQYNWYQLDGTTLLGSGTTLDVVTSQDTTIILTVTDVQNCSVNDTVTIFVIDPPTFNLNEVYCFENVDTLIDSDPIPDNVPGTYQWYTEGKRIFKADSTKLLVEETGEYIIAFNNDRCSVFDTTNVTQPILDNKALINFCKEDDGYVELDAGPGDRFVWLPGTDTVSTSTELVDSAGVYNFIVLDEFGCAIEDSITVIEICAPKVFVPSGIRPGGDPSDDKMEIFGVHYTNFTLTIYNRWGEVIYYTEDSENAWNGFYLDELMPVGTYPYIITYEGLTDRYKGPYQIEGKVTIIK